MTMTQIDVAMAPALGDIRELGEGDWIYIGNSATSREDWPRLWAAVGVAFTRGARLAPLMEI